MPLSASLDCIGPIARRRRSRATDWDHHGADGRDGSASRRPVPGYEIPSAPVGGLRIGVDESLLAR
jgi:hypothetical protein